jgi:polysaccharide biosynthesis protein PslA
MGERFAPVADSSVKSLGKRALTDMDAERRSGPAVLSLPLLGWIARVAEFLVVLGVSRLTSLLLAERWEIDLTANYGRLTIVAAFVYLLIADAMGLNEVDGQLSLRAAWRRVLIAWVASAAVLTMLGFLLKVSEEFSRGWVVVWFSGTAAGLLATRTLLNRLTANLKQQGALDQRVAIFGTGDQAERLADYIRGHDKLTLRIVGFYDDRESSRIGKTSLPLRGDIQELIRDIRSGRVDQVIIALPWSADQRLREIVETLALTPVRIRLAPEVASFIFASRPVVLLGGLPMMTLFERPISGFDRAIKALEDYVLGSLLLLLCAPVMLLVAIAIKLDSPGPVFFRQNREGFNNRPIRVWKFRSMHVDRCEQDGIVQATRKDPRVTRVGAFIRRTSLDELPQLFNVLNGSMSLVGPRPHAPSTKAGERIFSEVVATYAARHNVKPGITGWAQVCGLRGETRTEADLERRLQHDLHYVEKWSLWFDLYILLRTAASVLTHRTAY